MNPCLCILIVNIALFHRESTATRPGDGAGGPPMRRDGRMSRSRFGSRRPASDEVENARASPPAGWGASRSHGSRADGVYLAYRPGGGFFLGPPSAIPRPDAPPSWATNGHRHSVAAAEIPAPGKDRRHGGQMPGRLKTRVDPWAANGSVSLTIRDRGIAGNSKAAVDIEKIPGTL